MEQLTISRGEDRARKLVYISSSGKEYQGSFPRYDSRDFEVGSLGSAEFGDSSLYILRLKGGTDKDRERQSAILTDIVSLMQGDRW